MKRQSNAYIVELRGRFAAALTEDGRFIRVRNRGYEIGQAVRVEQPKQGEPSRRPAKRRVRVGALASMAAGFLLLLLGGFAGYRTPVGVVSLDVNPSIEYTINCFDRVLKMEAVNEDAEAILNQIDEDALLYQTVDTAVEQTIEALRSSGYLAEETENDLVLSASSYSAAHAEQLAARLAARAEKQKDLTVVSVSVSRSDVEEAHALGTSAGKLYLIERLQQATGTDEAFDPKDWLNTPVREIIRETATRSGVPQQNGEQDGQTPAGQQSPDATPPQSGTGATVPDGSTTSPQPTGGEQGGPVGPGQTDGSGGTGGAGGEPPAGGSPPG